MNCVISSYWVCRFKESSLEETQKSVSERSSTAHVAHLHSHFDLSLVQMPLAFIKCWSFLVLGGWIIPTYKTSHWFCLSLQIPPRQGLWSGDRERKEGYLEQALLVSSQDDWFSYYFSFSSLLSPCLLAMYITTHILLFACLSSYFICE